MNENERDKENQNNNNNNRNSQIPLESNEMLIETTKENDREYSILTSDSSMNNCLNETFFSRISNGSGEKEFKEYLFY